MFCIDHCRSRVKEPQFCLSVELLGRAVGVKSMCAMSYESLGCDSEGVMDLRRHQVGARKYEERSRAAAGRPRMRGGSEEFPGGSGNRNNPDCSRGCATSAGCWITRSGPKRPMSTGSDRPVYPLPQCPPAPGDGGAGNRGLSITRLLEAGSDIRTVQELLGHADVQYNHDLHARPAARRVWRAKPARRHEGVRSIYWLK